jgi:uncharacterized membrane protein (UPF0127 family)
MKESADGAHARAQCRKKGTLILAVAVIAGLLMAAAVMSGAFSGRAPLIQIAILNRTGGESHYTVFHATTQRQLTEGLMNYTFGNCTGQSCTGKIAGELFSFGSFNKWCFWMDNTPEPLVQAWLYNNGTVSYIYDGVPYSTNVICAYGTAVLELGQTLGIPLHVGDVLEQGQTSST